MVQWNKTISACISLMKCTQKISEFFVYSNWTIPFFSTRRIINLYYRMKCLPLDYAYYFEKCRDTVRNTLKEPKEKRIRIGNYIIK